ncbi:unnamed protein product [Lymnaea stagnalis]|uniref:Transglutaminase-like domain-containing protein n=1 Tax=Lymnaea stagnalis TaxID=6523 RepID=A0AAV2HX04_LYMST
MARARKRRSSPATPSTAPSAKIRKHRYHTRSHAKRAALLGGEQEGRTNWLSDDEHRSRIELLKPTLDVPGKTLGVKSIDFNKARNGRDHHTWEYEINDLVVRRGRTFALTIKFDRDIDIKTDEILLQFVFGNKPQESKGTLLRIKLNLREDSSSLSVSSKWNVKTQRLKKKSLDILVATPANAFVGKYGIFVETVLCGDKHSCRRFEVEDDELYLIFNPWCEADVVYMAEGDARYEYVLNDHGRIWVGSALNNEGRPWNYGQFDNPVLEAAIQLMDLAEVGDTARRSPLSFVRTISAMANSNDDNGVLEGRWTKKYPKGTHTPWSWTGSVRILEEFMSTQKPIKFGQCWVFAGLVTSLLRAIGIPTRCVTNFESAHDKDNSMTIDSHFDENDEPMAWMNDSIWNFHVWNESYFRRLDLPRGYDGWQAHDATPQEVSEGVMRCGPAPVKAVKEGHVYLNYDIPFIFSEVNGDKIIWKVHDNGEMSVIDINSNAIGRNISTKAVGSNFRHDLTLDYKYPDGSAEEQKVLNLVQQYSSRVDQDIYTRTAKDVEFGLVIPVSISVGDNFQIIVRAVNKSKKKHTVQGRVTVHSCFYTGVQDKRVDGKYYDVELSPNEENDLTLDLVGTEYIGKLNPEACMVVYTSLNVKDTDQHYACTQAFSLSKPVLEISIPDMIKVKEEFTGTLSFTNTLDISLTSATVHLDGRSVTSDQVHTFRKAIKPGETVTHDFKIRPRKAGLTEIEATITSDQISGVDGSVEFDVRPSDDGEMINSC